MATQEHAYSVWAIPPENARMRVRKLMDSLRSEFGGPELEPHITVVRAVTMTLEDALEKFRSACKGLKVYNVQARGVSTGTCLYLLFDSSPQVYRYIIFYPFSFLPFTKGLIMNRSKYY